MQNKTVYFKNGWLKLYTGRILTGKLFLHDLPEPASYISHFKIKPQFRSKGAGSYLLLSAIELSQQKGCSAISLHCAKSNEGALRFYKRNGFFIAATTVKASYSPETEQKENHYLMTRQI